MTRTEQSTSDSIQKTKAIGLKPKPLPARKLRKDSTRSSLPNSLSQEPPRPRRWRALSSKIRLRHSLGIWAPVYFVIPLRARKVGVSCQDDPLKSAWHAGAPKLSKGKHQNTCPQPKSISDRIYKMNRIGIFPRSQRCSECCRGVSITASLQSKTDRV